MYFIHLPSLSLTSVRFYTSPFLLLSFCNKNITSLSKEWCASKKNPAQYVLELEGSVVI